MSKEAGLLLIILRDIEIETLKKVMSSGLHFSKKKKTVKTRKSYFISFR